MARPRAADFEQHRDDILAMAARLFADRGYAAGSIAELAQACGVSKALLYHYYRDKEQLLFDIADRYIDSLLAIVDEVAAMKLPPQEHLQALIGRFMQAYRHAAAYHRVLVQDVKYLSATHRRRVTAKQNQVVAAFAESIAAVAPQLSRSVLLKPVTMTLFGMINWTFTWLKDDGEVGYEQMAPVVAQLFLSGVAALGGGARSASRINGDKHAEAGASSRRKLAPPPPPVPLQLPVHTVRRRRAGVLANKSKRETA